MAIQVHRGAEVENANSCIKIKMISSLLKNLRHVCVCQTSYLRFLTSPLSNELICYTDILIEWVNFA